MIAIMKRELSAYFRFPVGYVFIAVTFLCSGFFFWWFTLSVGGTDISSVFLGMFFTYMIFVPVLTMRLLADENKQKTDQLLLTSPISLIGLVTGKFLSAYIVFMLGDIVMLLYGVVMSFFVTVNWALILGNFVALALIGAVFVSAGMFVSSLTESQMVAAIGSIAINVAMFLMNVIASVIPIAFISDIIRSISIFDSYSEFTSGIFSLTGVVFFISIAAVFLFFTVRVLERRRWA